MAVVPAAAATFGGGTALQWMQAASPLLGQAMGGTPAGPSRADASLLNDAHFDSSGWVVATAGSSAEGKLTKTQSGSMGQGGAADPVSGMMNTSALVMLGLLLLLMIRLK